MIKTYFVCFNLIKILSSFLMSVLVSDWNWWMNLPKLSQALSDLSKSHQHRRCPWCSRYRRRK